MNFTRANLTDAGLALNAKIQAATGDVPLDITRIALGACTSQTPTSQTDVADPLDFFVPIIRQTSHGIVAEIQIQITNVGNPDLDLPPLAAAIIFQQIGFFAVDPDEGEILYRISQLDGPAFIPPATDFPYTVAPIYIFSTANAETVNITVDPAGLITVRMLEDFRNDLISYLLGLLNSATPRYHASHTRDFGIGGELDNEPYFGHMAATLEISPEHGLLSGMVNPPSALYHALAFVHERINALEAGGTSMAPSAPQYITVPYSVTINGPVAVSWTQGFDPQGDELTYDLQRQVGDGNGGIWDEVASEISQLTYTDTAPASAGIMTYRVRAQNAEGLYSEWVISGPVPVSTLPQREQLANLPRPRAHAHGATLGGDRAAVFAGYNTASVNGVFNQRFNEVDVWNRAGVRSALTATSFSGSAATTNLGGVNVIVAGSWPLAANAAVDMYNAAGVRSSLTGLSQNRGGPGVAQDGEQNAVIAGGCPSSTSESAVVDRYNTAGARGTLTAMSQPRLMEVHSTFPHGKGGGTIGPDVIFAGGWLMHSRNVPVGTVESYNTAGTRALRTALSVARLGTVATFDNGSAIVAGGVLSLTAESNLVEHYNTAFVRTAWTPLSLARDGIGAARLGNGDILLAGGVNGNRQVPSGNFISTARNTAESYNYIGVRTLQPPLAQARWAIPAATDGNAVVLPGGGIRFSEGTWTGGTGGAATVERFNNPMSVA